MGVSFPFAPFHKGLVAVKIGLSQSVLADCSATYWLSHAVSFQRQHAIPRPGKTSGLDTSESLPGSIEARCESNGYKHFAVIQQHQGSPAMMTIPGGWVGKRKYVETFVFGWRLVLINDAIACQFPKAHPQSKMGSCQF